MRGLVFSDFLSNCLIIEVSSSLDVVLKCIFGYCPLRGRTMKTGSGTTGLRRSLFQNVT